MNFYIMYNFSELKTIVHGISEENKNGGSVHSHFGRLLQTKLICVCHHLVCLFIFKSFRHVQYIIYIRFTLFSLNSHLSISAALTKLVVRRA